MGKIDWVCGVIILLGIVIPFGMHVCFELREWRREREARRSAVRKPGNGWCFRHVEWSGYRDRRR